jgi:itaconyl-CoA hydratase
MPKQHLVGTDNFYEDYFPGWMVRHSRGKTVGEFEVVTLAHLTMNSAQGHFNAHAMADTKLGRRIAFGGVVASIVVGLASQDTGENAVRELSVERLKLHVPVAEGDTLYAVSKVLRVQDADRPDAGIVQFEHFGINDREQLVCEMTRSLLILKRPTMST